MEKPQPGKKKNNDLTGLRAVFFWMVMILIAMWLANSFQGAVNGAAKKLTYSEFYTMLENNIYDPKIESLKQIDGIIEGEYVKEGAAQNEAVFGDDTYGEEDSFGLPRIQPPQEKPQEEKKGFAALLNAMKNGSTKSTKPTRFYVYVPREDKELLALIRTNVKTFEVEPPKTLWINLLYSMGPVILFVALMWYLSYKGNQMGSRVWSFGRARTQLMEKEKSTRVTFKDVAGVEEAKEELGEIIDFLKEPKKFQKLGGRIPKGVILVGPPGCGKTLLAKAVAGEAEVPFFSISGSDFVEMFVGVGASRVRDMFEQAKKASRAEMRGCILFIDEIDAVGRQRFAGIGGGHDEREQTLNQLLVEMDGFNSEEAIIVMAATNRPDVLDPALLRPGRFDRHIVIYPPDIKGREEILKVHTAKLKISPKAQLAAIAKQTPGFSGADLANLCNEAALLAARRSKESIEQEELLTSIERVMMGPEKKSRVMSKHEKELTAFHEAGHALLSLLIPEIDPLSKVSIIPRGAAGGYTFTPPKEDRHYRSRKELLGEISMALGGRVAEEMVFHDITTGAMRDLEEVTAIARRMVCDYGMSERIGTLTLGRSHGPVFLGRDLVEEKNYSEETAKLIDAEVKRIVDESHTRAKRLINDNFEKLKALAGALIEKEVLDAEEVERLLGLQHHAASTDNVL